MKYQNVLTALARQGAADQIAEAARKLGQLGVRLVRTAVRRQLVDDDGRRCEADGVEELAEVAHLSPRQFSRVFSAETGQSPAKAIEQLRLEAARLMIEQSRHSLDVIARESGFRDRRHLREVFIRGFGIPPQAVRRMARNE